MDHLSQFTVNSLASCCTFEGSIMLQSWGLLYHEGLVLLQMLCLCWKSNI